MLVIHLIKTFSESWVLQDIPAIITKIISLAKGFEYMYIQNLEI